MQAYGAASKATRRGQPTAAGVQWASAHLCPPLQWIRESLPSPPEWDVRELHSELRIALSRSGQQRKMPPLRLLFQTEAPFRVKSDIGSCSQISQASALQEFLID